MVHGIVFEILTGHPETFYLLNMNDISKGGSTVYN